MLRLSKTCLFSAALLLLAACASRPDAQARGESAQSLAAAAGWERMALPPLQGAAFDAPLTAFGPPAGAAIQTLRVYIEGDGLAWRSRQTPSDDPTPLDPVALQMALADGSGAAVYLARPCQYAAPATPACRDRAWWTQARFSAAVRDASGHAIDLLKQRYGAQDVVLVGYSGGGAVAALAGAQRGDVVRLVTVAGNLDTAAWVAHHRVSPLSASLNPADFAAALAPIAQHHFVGEDDAVMPPGIAQSYAARFAENAPVVIDVRAGQQHKCCWAQSWPALMHLAGLSP